MSDRPVYSVYGLSLASAFAFTTPLPASAEPPHVSFELVSEPPDADWDPKDALFWSPRLLDDGRPRLSVHAGRGCKVLRFTDVLEFYLWPDRIECYLLDPDYRFMVEIHLLGLVLSLWLALRGVLALHASAAATEAGTVAFLASNKGGKTSLAISVVQRGNLLLTDDVLAIRKVEGEYVAAPGFPQMRMWPDLAEHFLGSTAGLERYHPAYDKLRIPVGPGGVGAFCDEARPLRAIYLPVRESDGSEIEIEALSSSEAVIELVRNTFGVLSVEALGHQEARLELISEMLASVAVRRLRFPSGLELLPEVADAVMVDVADL